MGLSREIRYSTSSPPGWDQILEQLHRAGERPVLRMIDGLPAFPDEIPEAMWQELRVTLTGGMITLRRTPQGVSCVSWGTSDPGLERSWNSLTWACATAGSGVIQTSNGDLTPDDFARLVGLESA